MIHRRFAALKIVCYCKRVKILATDFKGTEGKSKAVFTLLLGDSEAIAYSFINLSQRYQF